MKELKRERMARQEALYNFLLARGDIWTSMEQCTDSISLYPAFFTGYYHNSAARRLLTEDIRYINTDPRYENHCPRRSGNQDRNRGRSNRLSEEPEERSNRSPSSLLRNCEEDLQRSAAQPAGGDRGGIPQGVGYG